MNPNTFLNLKPILFAGLCLGAAFCQTQPKGKGDQVSHHRIAILDLVDLGDNQPRPEASEPLRKAMVATGKWSMLSPDSTVKRLTEFNLNPRQPCNNPQCGFDIGNILQADFVLYGTSTAMGNMKAITLKLLNIPSAKIVWSKTLEAVGGVDNQKFKSLEKSFAEVAEEISKAKFDVEKTRAKRTVAVIDLSENSLTSRIFFERTFTRIHGSAQYDIMSPSELGELLAALEINKYSVVPSLDNMIGLGQKLGVSGLLYSRLYRDGKNFVYRLAMYDVTGKALVMELPPKPSEDLMKLLDYEKDFFNSLFKKELEAPKPALARAESAKSNKALWISLGLLGVGGGAAAFWVESLNGSDGNNPTADIALPRRPPTDRDR